MKLTDKQKKVIEANVGNILVSAAAGSGKTSVMTRRIVERIVSHKLSVKEILVMTFTEAAAGNMKLKIEELLLEAMENTQDSSELHYLYQELSYLSTAHISTIHAFCLDVIRTFSSPTPEQKILIEPGFNTVDSAEQSLLFKEAMETVFSQLYRESYLKDQIILPQEAINEGIEEDSPKQLSCFKEDRKKLFYPQDKAENVKFQAFTIELMQQTELDGVLHKESEFYCISKRQWLDDFKKMAMDLGGSLSDTPLKEIITSLHSYLRSLPHYFEFIQQKRKEYYHSCLCFSSSVAAKVLWKEFGQSLELAAEKLYRIEKLLPEVIFVKDKKKQAYYQEYYASTLHILRRAIHHFHIDSIDWDFYFRLRKELPVSKGASLKKTDLDQNKIDFLQDYQSVKEVFYYMTGSLVTQGEKENFKTLGVCLFSKSQADIELDLQSNWPSLQSLVDVFILIDNKYQQIKSQKKIVDFSDYEHFALELLTQEKIKTYYGQLFKEIYIDEYQDNSRIQDQIVSSFAKQNSFLVGDVKQSIYGFRHAKPEMFMQKAESYKTKEMGNLFELNSNFRSHDSILKFINLVFDQLMSLEAGEINYDEFHRFVLPEIASQPGTPKVNIMLLDLKNTEKEPEQGEAFEASSGLEESETQGDFFNSSSVDLEEVVLRPEVLVEVKGELGKKQNLFSRQTWESLSSNEKQAYIVAEKIIELVKTQELAWKDFAILTRTNKLASVYQKVFQKLGIPASGPGESRFVQSKEIFLLEKLLQLLDNLYQDIPLVAVMRAPFPQSNFSNQALLEMVVWSQDFQKNSDPLGLEDFLGWETSDKWSFYQIALLYYHYAPSSALKQKVVDFFDWIDSWRHKLIYFKIAELLEGLYLDTKWRESLSKESDGKTRMKDLEIYLAWAENFERNQRRGLYDFIQYARELRKKAVTPELFNNSFLEPNQIQCMSIHKSKGLEFGYVFMVGLEKNLFRKGLKEKFFVSEAFGFAMDNIQLEGAFYFRGHSKLAIEQGVQKALLAEELRLFYVAMTRTEKQLFLVGNLNRDLSGKISDRMANFLTQAWEQKKAKLPAWLVGQAKSYLDFLLLAISRYCFPQMAMVPTNELAALPDLANRLETEFFCLDYYAETKLFELFQGLATVDISPILKKDPKAAKIAFFTLEELALFQQQLEGTYSRERFTRIPNKVSVSALKRRVNDFSYPLETELPVLRPINLMLQSPEESRPFSQAIDLDPALKGTLLHSLFCYLDLSSLQLALYQKNIKDTDDVDFLYRQEYSLKNKENLVTVQDIDALLDDELGKVVSFHMIQEKHISFYQTYRKKIFYFAVSDLAKRIVKAEQKSDSGPYREIPFSLKEKTDQGLFIQGMIDCWFIEDGKAILIDYKSDQLRGSLEDQRKLLQTRYQEQINYYTMAIEGASGLEVKERIIWSIEEGRMFSL